MLVNFVQAVEVSGAPAALSREVCVLYTGATAAVSFVTSFNYGRTAEHERAESNLRGTAAATNGL